MSSGIRPQSSRVMPCAGKPSLLVRALSPVRPPTANRSPRTHSRASVGETGREPATPGPQTSPYFPRGEFDLEWFCGEMVGMTTRVRVLDLVGIAWVKSPVVV
jgi:hypothetical protein